MTDGDGATGAYLRVCGPLAFIHADHQVTEFSPTQQRLLARLVVSAPQAVRREDIAASMWGRDQPVSARQAIQNQVSRIRTVLGENSIETTRDGYCLAVDTDLARLQAAASHAESVMAAPVPGFTDLGAVDAQTAVPAGGASEEIAAIFSTLNTAVDRVRGEVLADLDYDGRLDQFRERARSIIRAATHLRLEAALRIGRHDWALMESARLVQEFPFDERAAASYARALALVGRRGEALSTLARIRRELRINFGLESGVLLDSVEAAILHGGGRAVAHVDAGGPPPLVGRRDEMRRILQAVARRHPVRVCGEHGAGVSRVLFEARSRLIRLGVQAVLVRAEEHPHSATSVIEEFLFELGTPRTPGVNALSAFTAVAEALDADTPTVFIIDDVQFLGPSSWQALRVVAAAEYGALILGGHGHVPALDGQVEVTLGPLPQPDIALIANHLGVTDTTKIDALYQASGGNPLAARLLAQSPHSFTVPPTQELSGDGAHAISDFLEHLIGGLDTNRRHDLQLAAVAGDGYPVAAFDHLAWAHQPQLPLELVDVDASGSLRFRHGLLQAHLYRALPRGMRLDMHHSLGIAARDSEAPAGTVARHLLAAAELDPQAAIAAARTAAQHATLLGAHADAANWLAHAREIADHDERRAPQVVSINLAIEHADARRLAGEPGHLDDLMAAVRRALASHDDSLISAAGFALLQLGASSPAGRPHDLVADVITEILAAIKDPQARAPVQAAASLAWSMTGNADTARSLFDRAEAAAIDPTVRLSVLPFAYLAVGRPADLPRRAALAVELLGSARAANNPIALWEGLHLEFTVAMQFGDGPAMRTALAEMEQVTEKIGDVGRRWSALYCAATVAEIDGDLERSETLATQAHAVFASVAPSRADAALFGQLLQIRLRQGRLAEICDVVEQLLAAQPGVTAWHAAAALVLADALERDGNGADEVLRSRAVAHAQQTLDVVQDDFLWLAAHVIAGRAVARLGDPDLIDAYITRLKPWAELVCWQGVCSYGAVADVLADLSDARCLPDVAATYRTQAAALERTLRATANDPGNKVSR